MDFGICNFDREQYGKFEDSIDINQDVFETVDIKRGIFQGDSLLQLLLLILKDTRDGYQLQKGCSINHLLFMDDLKLYEKNSN